MLINPTQTQDPYSPAALNSLITQIDEKILCLSLDQLNSIRFSVKTAVDLDIYEDLSFYKDILKQKMLGCNCLEDFQLTYIVSTIKRLLNTLNCQK